MSIKQRLSALETTRKLAGCVPETIIVNPWRDRLEPPTPEALEAHRAEVRRVGANPCGFLICLREGIGPDPLAELLGADDPLVRQQGPGIALHRSYG